MLQFHWYKVFFVVSEMTVSYNWLRRCVGGWGWVFAQSFSHVQLFATSWTVTHQAPLATEFSRREYWSELPFPTLGDERVTVINYRNSFWFSNLMASFSLSLPLTLSLPLHAPPPNSKDDFPSNFMLMYTNRFISLYAGQFNSEMWWDCLVYFIVLTEQNQSIWMRRIWKV